MELEGPLAGQVWLLAPGEFQTFGQVTTTGVWDDTTLVLGTNKGIMVAKHECNGWAILHSVVTAKPVVVIKLSHCRTKMYFLDRAGDIHVMDRSVEPRLLLQGGISTTLDFCIDRDSKYIYSACSDGKIQQSVYSAPFVIQAYMLHHCRTVSAVAISYEPEIAHLVVSASEQCVCLWDTAHKPPSMIHQLDMDGPVTAIFPLQEDKKLVLIKNLDPCLCIMQIRSNKLAVLHKLTSSETPQMVLTDQGSRELCTVPPNKSKIQF